MSASSRKTFITTTLLVMLGAGILFFLVTSPAVHNLFGSLTNTAGSAAAAGKASIADIAANYYGTLSRPLIPEVSGFLPFWVQVTISVIIMVLMLLVGLLFPKARGFLILLTAFAVGRNLVWRAVDTLNLTDPIHATLSIILYVAEISAFISLLLGYFQLYKPTERSGVPFVQHPNEPIPSVDVYLCTYNEPVSVLYRGLVGCQAMDYPNKTVYLLDDGNRPEMAKLAAHLGVEYISREKNTHAKAGNMNNAMKYTNGDLIVVFDADHVPARSFLKETVGFFQKDRELAYVQTPQHFFTHDPFQRNLAAEDVVTNEQDFFFHVIQPGNDHWGATFFAGSGALFSRRALDDVGGFATDTITEDVHTGIRLHSKGWKSALYNKNLAAGMAQDCFADFVKQRLRWARGMAQIIFNDNPWFVKGLTFAQRVCYTSGIWYFFNGIHRLIFLVAPLAFLLFGFMTINAGAVELAVYYVPSFLCLFWGYSILTHGYRHIFWAEVYETAMCVYMSIAALGTVFSPRHGKFKVTPKGTVSERLYFNWRLVLPQLIIASLIVLGVGMAAYRAYHNIDYWPGIVTNLFWAAYNLSLLIGAIYVAQERPQFRLTPRVPKRLRCELRLLDGTIAVGYTADISESGMAVMFDEPIPIAGTMALKLLDWDGGETSIFQVQAVRSMMDDNNRHMVGLRVVNRTDEQHQKLVRHMFGGDEIWEEVRQDRSLRKSVGSFFNTPGRISGLKETAFRRRTPRFKASLPVVIRTQDDQILNAYSQEVSETGLSIQLPANTSLELGQPLQLKVQWTNGEQSTMMTTVKRLEKVGDQLDVGVNFNRISREQRVELIQQIYGSREGLIRVAPPVTRMLRCAVLRQNGQVLSATSQEVSEMGVRLFLDKPASLQQEETVKVQLFWGDNQSTQLDGLLLVPDLTGETVQTGGPGKPAVIVYFRNASLEQLDELSAKMHAADEVPKLA